MNYDAQINLEDLYSTDPHVNKNPAVQFVNIYIKSLMSDMKFVEIGRHS